jgi:hypothetical protein
LQVAHRVALQGWLAGASAVFVKLVSPSSSLMTASVSVVRISGFGAPRDTYRSTSRCRLIAVSYTQDQPKLFAVDRGPQPRGCKAAAASVAAGPRASSCKEKPSLP